MTSQGTPRKSLPALPVQTAATVLERLELERSRTPGPVMIASDGDGTLWKGDIGVEVFTALLGLGGVREDAREALLAEAREAGIAVSGSPTDIAQTLQDAWLEHRMADERAYAMHAWGFAGWSAVELEIFVTEVLTAGGIEARTRHELGPILAWARDAGVELHVVSASPEAAVRHAAAGLGIGPDRVIAMAPAWAGDVVLPRLAAPAVYGAGKVLALERAAPGVTLLGAFGDSGYDAPMLARARVPVAVDPKPALIDAARAIPGLVVLA